MKSYLNDCSQRYETAREEAGRGEKMRRRRIGDPSATRTHDWYERASRVVVFMLRWSRMRFVVFVVLT